MASSSNKIETDFPSRIVCLSYDTLAILSAIGCTGRIVGKPTGAAGPGMENAADIGGFARPDVDAITTLKPDIVIGYSEISANTIAQLVRKNINTLVLQHTSLDETYASIALLGRVTGNVREAAKLISTMCREFREIAALAPEKSRRPVVYFEEWNKPCVCGVQWVSEIIGIAGGNDGFAHRCQPKRYLEREVTTAEVAAVAPEIIFASWCGNPVDIDSIKSRPGWESVPAVRNAQIYAVPGEIILQPGPWLVKGARFFADIVSNYAAEKTR
jgi:iron complex transport system substrate-binding protein